MKIFGIGSTLKAVGKSVTKPVSNPLLNKDVRIIADSFVKQDNQKLQKALTPLELAKKFKSEVCSGYSDWNDLFPRDGESGSDLTKQIIEEYTASIEKMNVEGVETFCKLSMGTNHIKCLKESAKENKSIANFVNLLESKLSRNLESLYKN